MLKGIAPCISPNLLKVLAEMGHGDELVLADAHFPGHTMNPRVLRADGVFIPALLEGILPLFELDSYAPPVAMMAPVKGDQLDPEIQRRYFEIITRFAPNVRRPVRLHRFAFYERSRQSFAIVMTGDTAKVRQCPAQERCTPVAPKSSQA